MMMLAFAVIALYLSGNTNNVVSPEILVFFKQHETTLTKNSIIPSCDFFSGRWVYDDVSYPLYKEGKFNGTTLLEKLRDKKLVFVGDSLCRNQWRSLLCLTEPYFPPSTNRTLYDESNSRNLHVKDYNATIAFYWAPYLVESNCDDPFNHKSKEHLIRIKSIEKHGRHWINADILIFDSFVWWFPNLTIVWSPFDIPNPIYKNVISDRPFQIAIDTWADWLEFHIDRNKTKIFFMSSSPYQPGTSIWITSGACYNTTEPIFDDRFWGELPKLKMKCVESTIEKLQQRGVKVVYLNITQLSSYREDAHPSIYVPDWKTLYQIDYTNNVVSPENLVIFKQQHETIPTQNVTIQGCNLFSGKWVYDDVSYPLYKEGSCALIGDEFSSLLEKLRDKKLVFVGDSLCRNQWKSLLCLIEPYLPSSTNKNVVLEGNFFNMHVKDYNATIGFYWAPYLVESNCDDIILHKCKERVIQVKSIEKHGRHWTNADILIFDTFAWWIYPELTISWGSFDGPNAIYKKLKTSMRQFEVVLNTWSDFMEFHIDGNKTKIFFVSASPYRLGKTHFGTSPTCYNRTEPIFDETYWPTAVNRSLMEIVESTIEKLGKNGIKVEYLNITQLSGYREDAHPSIHKRLWKSAEKDKDPNKYSDSHAEQQLQLPTYNTESHLVKNDKIRPLYQIRYNNNVVSPENLVVFKKQHETTLTQNGTTQGCNLFSGKWVYDDVSYPLYKEGSCAFIENDFACEKNGRKNLKYQNWRWQPHHCDLPKVNGTALLEKLRDKKLVFVGDSLCRNQWRSLLCLIEPYLPPSTIKNVVLEGNFLNMHVKDYNATIAFYWAPFLVESNSDNLLLHRSKERAIQFKSIEKHGRHWIDADILIFDTFAWWIYPELTILWGSFDSPNAIYKKLKTSIRQYEVVLNTWSDFMEFHIDGNKTKIFFMSASPFRLGTTLWGTSETCYNRTEPIFDETYWPTAAKRGIMEIVESTIEKLEKNGIKVEYLNITQLSGYREDAHPSIYKRLWKSAKKDKDPNKYSDCMHWCLPGVPDVWNQILYSYIMKP
ncbi:hypothetical protein C2S52_000080 [Perilla frutescens var. hirtella]|nr:hypothetical protein C2S52_000080 [Perilla frutescens var. hirtella]